MLINQSRFKLNGNVGYVRKPDFLLSKSFDPANSKTFPRKTPLRFKVKVSSHLSTREPIRLAPLTKLIIIFRLYQGNRYQNQI